MSFETTIIQALQWLFDIAGWVSDQLVQTLMLIGINAHNAYLIMLLIDVSLIYVVAFVASISKKPLKVIMLILLMIIGIGLFKK